MRGAHALAVPVSFGLLVTAYYLYRRRHRALQVALALMAALTLFNVVKGLDTEEAVLTAVAAALLWAGRSLVLCPPDPGRLRSARGACRCSSPRYASHRSTAVSIAAPASASAWTSCAGRATLLLWQRPPFAFAGDELAQTGLAVELTGCSRCSSPRTSSSGRSPLQGPPRHRLRKRRRRLVREHGADTLSFFKRGRQALPLQPRTDRVRRLPIESGVLMISGDPVGEPNGLAKLMPEHGRVRGRARLRLSALGVSAEGRALFEQAGLRALYMGDEAIVDSGSSASKERRSGRCVSRSPGCARPAIGRRSRSSARSGPVVARLEEWRRLARRRPRARLQHGDGLAPQPGRPGHARRLRRRRGRHDPRVPPLRADVRARRSIAVVHAPRAGDSERPHGVPGRGGGSSTSVRAGIIEVSLEFAASPAPSAAERGRSSGHSGAHSWSATRGSRSSASTGSTRSSSRDGSRATSCTSAGSA